MLSTVFFLAVFLAVDVNAIIPLPCANESNFETGECCPTPTNLINAGPCGSSLKRGSCISITKPVFNPSETDVRRNWPVQYFSRVCKCNERFGGVDCGECSFAYNDGTTTCTTKTIRPRVSVSSMNDDEWNTYREALSTIKTNTSRYKVATTTFPGCNIVHPTCTRRSIAESVVKSLVQPNTYDLFVWLHHLVAKDNDVTKYMDIQDYAHEGPGFPTWHRLLLLWLEREIQIATSNHTFRVPYWDWSDSSQREILFQRDRLGENVKMVDDENVTVVEGDLFTEWKTYCWVDTSKKTFPPQIPICNPIESSNQILRRCPKEKYCKKESDYWPSKDDIEKAVSIGSYDASPYNRSIKNYKGSFRNYMEGFVFKTESDCRKDDLCDTKYKESISRKLHNSVHIILGIGSLKNISTFKEQGVMSCVAASPNDPIFINHHANIDCILEQWLQKNKDCPSYTYPMSDEIREGHRRDDYIVPFIPVYTHKDMFKTADNFGYTCPGSAFSTQAFTAVVVGLASAAITIVTLDL